VIEDGRNGLLTDFFDVHAIAHRISDALARREELAPLRAAARETIVARYGLTERCLPAQLALLEQA
jgi:glycosyltransferase involved in cell wall biosynthesis